MPRSHISDSKITVPQGLRLPLAFLSSYLFFLSRRPISKSNHHFLDKRLRALKSLQPFLAELDAIGLDYFNEQLSRLNTVNFQRLAGSLQAQLHTLLLENEKLPYSHIYSNSPPMSPVLKTDSHVLLIMGPAIGIGDEIMFFRTPGWIKQCCPDARVTVFSGYDQLWDRVSGVDETHYYDDYPILIQAMRGEESFSQFDTIILADFEKPGLHGAICEDANLQRYVEISTGAHTAVVVDNNNRWVHMTETHGPYCANYYLSLCRLFSWLGVPNQATKFDAVVDCAVEPGRDKLTLFVSPFTSKYDPSQVFWSHLLSQVCRQCSDIHINLILDAGANNTTARFVEALQRSVMARTLGDISIEISQSEGARNLSLPNVFDTLEKADVVICADSFIAHAAPIMNCTTMVVAADNLADWRVPHGSSFYFSAEAPVNEIAIGIVEILKCLTSKATFEDIDNDLVTKIINLLHAANALQEQVSRSGSSPSNNLYSAYDAFVGSYKPFVTSMQRLTPSILTISGDSEYRQLPGALCNDGMPHASLFPDVLAYIQDQLNHWNNSNLHKYFNMASVKLNAMSRARI